MTRETVATDTPLRRATSWMLARLPPSLVGSVRGPHDGPRTIGRRYGRAGLASRASSSAWSGNHAPAAGSTMPPHSGSVVEPATPRLHEPSDSPGTLIQRYASTSAFPATGAAAGRGPSPRPGGLHQSCLSGYAVDVVHGPLPFRLVSTTKCVAPVAVSRVSIPEVFSAGLVEVALQTPYGLSATPVHAPRRAAIIVPSGPPFQYWFGQPAKSPEAMHREIHVPYCTAFCVNW